MKRYLVGTILFTLILVSGCALARQREQIQSGMLTTGLDSAAFLSEWGTPTRTSTMTGDEAARAEWGTGPFHSFSGSFVKGKQVYDVWDYDGEVTLVFQRNRGRLQLATWKTAMDVSQLQDWSARRARSR